MLLDEWSDQDLALARAIGAGRSTASAVRPASGVPGGGSAFDELDALNRIDPFDPLADQDRHRIPGVDREREPDPFDDAVGDTAGDTGEDRDAEGRDDAVGVYDAEGRPDARRPDADGAVIALDLKPCGGDGVVLSLAIDGQRARAWVDADAWCEWLAPRLAVQRFHQIPPDLLGMLGQWTLLPLQHHARHASLGAPHFCAAEPGSCARAIAPTLTLSRAGAALDLRLLDWPENWVAALAQTMEDRRPPLTIPPIPVALAAGWIRLTRAQLDRLAPGDGIVLARPAAVEQGHAWLVAERSLALARFAHGAWHIEHAFNEEISMEQGGDAALRGSQLDDDNIVLTAVAEVGRLSLSLDTLRDLQSGQVLELAHASHGRVTLTVSGQAIASGTLLRLGDKLVMRIE